MNRTHTLIAGVAAAVALALAATTYAQPSGGMGQGFGPGMGMGPGHGPMAGGDPSVMIDSHLSDVKTRLQITAAQEVAWQAFAAQAKQQAAGMQAMRTQMQHDSGTAPERMAHRSTAMQQRGAAMATMATAFNALYAVLTAEQKAVADQNLGMMGHRGMRF